MNNREYRHMQRMMALAPSLEKKYVGKTIRIISMQGEPDYDGREGVVEDVDSMGQLHGTWGGLAVQTDRDSIKIIN